MHILAYMLEDQGHSVVEAADGLERLSKFESGSPDLILMDVMICRSLSALKVAVMTI